MKRKIGLLIPNLLHGGAERVLAQLSYIFSEDNEVYVILFDGERISYDYEGQLINLDCPSNITKLGKISNVFKRVYRLNKMKKELKLDLVISFLRSANIVNYLSSNLGKKIISCRGYTEFKESNKMYAKMLKKLDGIIFPSETMSQEFLEQNSLSKEKVFTLYNPLNIEKIKDLKDHPVSDELYEFLRSHRTICTLGSFKKDKGQWHLLKALSLLKQKNSDIGLVFIGDQGELETEIKKMAAESGFAEDIIFVGYQNNPYKILSKCDVFVLPSVHEGFPNALIEAMSCNIPLISTDCKSGPREILHVNFNSLSILDAAEQVDFGVLVPVLSNTVDFNYKNISKEHNILARSINEVLSNNIKFDKEVLLKRANKFSTTVFKESIYNIINIVLKNNKTIRNE
ncbi:glycosyltransferase [Paenibacillus sp. J5C_2022]|uniref:glycosyltransferase n=1 Tax=Paenibacillus sp. J5C2022 TaxID=2977129 RepID=UPI0021CF5E26|nr:glycosyltransferase [Paenibacillus sp. J5C2022]MCU6708777.1 glycosyltransferase [Paenibacillus sp. J5C2022]